MKYDEERLQYSKMEESLKFCGVTRPRKFSQRRFTILTYKSDEEIGMEGFLSRVQELVKENDPQVMVVEAITSSNKKRRMRFKSEKVMKLCLNRGVSDETPSEEVKYVLNMLELWIENHREKKMKEKIREHMDWLLINFGDIRSRNVDELERALESIRDKRKLLENEIVELDSFVK